MTDLGPKESSDLHRNLSDNIEPSQLDFSFMNWTDPDLGKNMLREDAAEIVASNRGVYDPVERSEVHGDSDAISKGRRKQGNFLSETSDKKSSSWRWTFKWKWGPKSKSKSAKGAAKGRSEPMPRPITSGQRPNRVGDTSPTADIMSDARDTFVSQSDRYSSLGTAEKLASDRGPKHRRVLSWGAGTECCNLLKFLLECDIH